MVSRPLILNDTRAGLRKLSAQVNSLHALEHSLNVERAKGLAARFEEGPIPDGYAGFVAVPRLDHFGTHRIPESAIAWGASSGWDLRAAYSALEKRKNFLSEHFRVRTQTLGAFEALEAQQGAPDEDRIEQNPIRIFPIRAAWVDEDEEPRLDEGEFFLDLASTMWVLAVHSKWVEAEPLMLACFGERMLHGILTGRTMFVGYRQHHRVMNFAPQLSIALIGRIPVLP